LRGVLAIDDCAGRWADAAVTVRADGKILAEFSSLRNDDSPRNVDVSLDSAMELTIEVGFGRHGDVQDRVNFVNPVLIRKPAATTQPS
jgi:hypothetical protein